MFPMKTKIEGEDLIEKLGKVIRNLDKSKTEIAEELEVTRQALNMWLRGARNPSEENIKKIKIFIDEAKDEILEAFFEKKAGENSKGTYFIGGIEVPVDIFGELIRTDESEIKEVVKEALIDEYAGDD